MIGYSNVLDTLDTKAFPLCTYSQLSFSSSTWKRGRGMDVTCKLGEELNANNDK